MKFNTIDNNETIAQLRVELYKKLSGPIDAMWEQLYIASAQHYTIEKDSKTIGYCCIDEVKSLKQIFLIDDYIYLTMQTINALINEDLICKASVSANEPISFNACLFYAKSMHANTFCFEYSNRAIKNGTDIPIVPVSKKDMPSVKAFFKNQIGFDDTFGYTENLVQRKELYLVKEGDSIVATSECRWSDSQVEFADLGVIVSKDHQGKGIATQILKQQIKRVLKANRKPICSTTLDNVASKKAIEKAGFHCSNIIFDLNFIE